ncbi:sulfite oxidase-like oxidoreductase [Frankia sp. BMG5.23]|nr:sulfite oxidase-like oxidoreductase [Frankia sp. BMG5.23]
MVPATYRAFVRQLPRWLPRRLPRLLTEKLPEPPPVLRRGPLRENAFPSRLHDPRMAALLGVWLGIAFGTCFLTGLVSHFMQHPPSWLEWPSRPAWLYRVTQGLHVTTGLASVPLLLAKLWTVYPLLWEWPPIRSVAHAVERMTIVPLIAGAIFQLSTGIANIAQWYRFHFFFTVTHYWVAWITIGALVLHIVAKLTVIRANVGRRRHERAHLAAATMATTTMAGAAPGTGGLTRRGLGLATGTAAGVIVATTAGQSVPGLARLDLLAPRRPDIGPQGLPVNRTARAARVTSLARDPGYRLEVVGPRRVVYTIEELHALRRYSSKLPITCVEGWAADATWHGPRLRDLLDAAMIPADATVRVESLEARGGYRASDVNPSHARDSLTLLATGVNGADLDLDHGYPARLIAPNRPGVLQTKWVHRVVMV